MSDQPPSSPQFPPTQPASAGATGGPTTPPGWYPAPDGTTRWWDGAQWGQAAPPAPPPATVPVASAGGVAGDTGMAVLAQVLGIFTGFLGPLVIYLVSKPEQAFVRHHAAEALNFQITVTIAYFVSFLAMFVLIGFVLLPIVIIGSVVLMIVAAIAANRGEWYRYPINLRLVPGAVGG